MRIPTQNEMTALETLVDNCGLFEVVFALRVICGDKADHITASYGYDALAKEWERAGRDIERASGKVINL